MNIVTTIVLNETIILLFYMAVGAFLNFKRKYHPSVNVFIGYLLTNIALPAAILNSFQVEKTTEVMTLMRATFGYSFILLSVTLLVGLTIATLFKKKDSFKRLWINCLTFSNILFIGIPIVEKLYGEQGLIILVVYNTVANLFLFTIGMMIFSNSRKMAIRQMLTTPALLAAVIGFLFFYFEIHLPFPLLSFTKVMGGMTAPLSMVINGVLFSQNNFIQLLLDKDNLQFTLARSIIVPLLFIPILQLIVPDKMILGILTLIVAMPTGALNAILAEKYGGNGNKASQYIALTTVISMITLPVVMLL